MLHVVSYGGGDFGNRSLALQTAIRQSPLAIVASMSSPGATSQGIGIITISGDISIGTEGIP